MAPETPSLKSDTDEEAEDDDAFEGGACKKLVEDLALLDADLIATLDEDVVGADDAAAEDKDDDNEAGTAEEDFPARRDAVVVIAVAEVML